MPKELKRVARLCLKCVPAKSDDLVCYLANFCCRKALLKLFVGNDLRRLRESVALN
jgi:hypothetical protein